MWELICGQNVCTLCIYLDLFQYVFLRCCWVNFGRKKFTVFFTNISHFLMDIMNKAGQLSVVIYKVTK